ncbi:MAG: FlgB family protein [Rhodobacteraceae bacterium]|nr:FlgB family protein [Paracoccaceae bacterium]
MFENLDIFKMASGMARHAVTRQEVIAKNIANADTPEYRAKDIASFADTYDTTPSDTKMRTTRAGHMLDSTAMQAGYDLVDAPGATSPNGNTVSLETEMMKSSQVRHEHELALSVYKSSMNILRTSIGRK